jgi:elongation factor Tu
MNRAPDAEVILRLDATADGGKKRSVLSGYRPNYAVRPDYLTSVHHQFVGVHEVSPGGEGRANVWFLTPEAYPHTLWPGRKISVSEGSTLVGSAIILSVFNPILGGAQG